uniref:Uncharacterized protein n=1 Tax=Arundo donax TaxID=35708 RepID=A0A0A8XUM3_ARUDO
MLKLCIATFLGETAVGSSILGIHWDITVRSGDVGIAFRFTPVLVRLLGSYFRLRFTVSLDVSPFKPEKYCSSDR